MAPALHWNWTAASLLTTNVAQIAVGSTVDARGNPGALSLVFIGTDAILLNARQRVAADSTSWEMQPSFLTGPDAPLKAKQFSLCQSQGGALDLFVVGSKNEILHFRQSTLGNAWTSITPAPFAGTKVEQLSAVTDSLGNLQLVAVATNGHISRQRQAPDGINWNSAQSLGQSGKQVAIAANPNNSNLLEIFFIDQHNVISHLRQQNAADDVHGWGASTPLLTSKPTAKEFVVTQNVDGRLEIFAIDTNTHLFHIWQVSNLDTTQWSDKTRFAGDAAKQISVTLNEDGRLETFYIGTDDNLYHNWQSISTGNWVGETIVPGYSGKQVAVAQNVGDGHLEVFWIDKNNALQHSWQTEPNSGWTNTSGLGGPATAPPTLEGNENYILLTGNCGLLTDVAVTISITQDLVLKSDGKPVLGLPAVDGLAWQLNCAGRTDDLALLQQYVIVFTEAHIKAQVNNWAIDPGSKLNGFKQLINSEETLVGLSGHKIPAGFQFVITLNNDGFGNITSATFLAINPNGDNVGKKTINIKSAIVGPIVEMQLNLVGPGDGESVTLLSGAGSIEYVASSILTASANAPACSGLAGAMLTAEASNATYGTMSADPSNLLQQTFAVAVGATPFALHKETLRPPTPKAGS